MSIVLRNLKQENPTLVLLRRQITETQTSIKNIMDAIEDGIRTATTKQRLIELEKTQNELELKIVKEELRRPKITKEELTFWLKRFQQLDTNKKEHKQRLIDSFVNAVFIYDDKIVLTFNYKEANKTVTLSEVNGSIIECKGSPKKRAAYAALFFWPWEIPRFAEQTAWTPYAPNDGHSFGFITPAFSPA